MTYELGIIGAGKMAEAMARGVMARGVLKADQIIAADVSPERRELFEKQLSIRAVDENLTAAQDSRIILLSVKPQQMATALGDMGAYISDQTLVISIAAGIRTDFIEKHLGLDKKWRVVRVMPNTPMLVGEGIAALAAGVYASAEDVAAARRLFEAAASVIEVEEDKMNAVTALSGSGPAYFFFLVEQMVKAGVEMGMSEHDAHLLACKTALGAAKMLVTSSDGPAILRKNVTSPGGTTEAAITYMAQHDWPKITIDAIKSAGKRGGDLGG